MNNIELYWNEAGYGIAYSDSMDLYEMEKYLVDYGYIITRVNGGYVHFYDPKKVSKLYVEKAIDDTKEEKTENEYSGFQEANGIGETVDVVIDKKGREWPIVRLHEGIYGFRDCPFCAQYNESGKNGPFEKSDAYKATIKWLDENMTPEQRKRWGEPFLASLYNIMGEKAYKYANPVEGEIQFDYYKDWHNCIKSCPDLYDEDQTDFGSWYWTSSPLAGYTGHECDVLGSGDVSDNFAYLSYGVAPCFAVKSLNRACSETADRPSGEEVLMENEESNKRVIEGGLGDDLVTLLKTLKDEVK